MAAASISASAIRIFSMGERGATDQKATDGDLGVMRACVLEAMRAGALGLATGRTTLHRTPAGDPVPGTFADRRELDAICGALAEYGTGVLELVALGVGGEDRHGFEKDFEWMLPVALETGRPVSFGLVQASAGRFAEGRANLEKALRERSRIFGTAHPLVAGTQVSIAEADFAAGMPDLALAGALDAERDGRAHLLFTARYLPERVALAYAARRPRGRF